MMYLICELIDGRLVVQEGPLSAEATTVRLAEWRRDEPGATVFAVAVLA